MIFKNFSFQFIVKKLIKYLNKIKGDKLFSFYNLFRNSKLLMQQAAIKLGNIFQDPNFAWQLLNAQIQIEMSHVVSGDVIAYLLQLYMRGVERMNSLADPRESYFKNKVTSLMTKQTVIKSLKENPMKKKAKPHETSAKQEPKRKEGEKQTRQKTPKKKKTKKQDVKEPVAQQLPTVPTLNPLELKQKRLELEKRMAYVAEQHGPDSLKKIIAQQDHREQNITSKISKIINSHEQRLNERIKARKLRTATFRTRSQVNMQEGDNQPNVFYENQVIKEDERFAPFEQVNLSENKIQQNGQSSNAKVLEKTQKRYKSLQIFRNIESPQKKVRKYTFDETNALKEASP